MKKAYAVRRTVPPSAEIEEQIDRLLAVGVGENPRESLSELAKLGARLIIQRAVEEEFDARLGRARYERRPEHQRGLRNYDSGLRNGFRPRRVQTAEGELEVAIPQVREAAETFASKLSSQDPEAAADRAAEGAGARRTALGHSASGPKFRRRSGELPARRPHTNRGRGRRARDTVDPTTQRMLRHPGPAPDEVRWLRIAGGDHGSDDRCWLTAELHSFL
jgi:Transposase, Mutator family